jgi:hypothetical protein
MVTTTEVSCGMTAAFFGFMGVTFSLVFSSKLAIPYTYHHHHHHHHYIVVVIFNDGNDCWIDLGSAFGTAKSGVGIGSLGVTAEARVHIPSYLPSPTILPISSRYYPFYAICFTIGIWCR